MKWEIVWRNSFLLRKNEIKLKILKLSMNCWKNFTILLFYQSQSICDASEHAFWKPF